jgi:GNAT superfamily N-acetyltransferase
MTSPTPYRLRLQSKSDEPSIYSDWLRSARKSRTYAGVKSQVFYFWQHLVIEQLLIDPSVTWLVASSLSDPTKIYGWLCGQRADTLAGDQAVIHYLYVKRLYRRVGIASRLIESFAGSAPALVVTSMTDSGRALLGDRTFVFNPFLQFARTPETAPKVSARSLIARSRSELAGGGFDPAEEGDEP